MKKCHELDLLKNTFLFCHVRMLESHMVNVKLCIFTLGSQFWHYTNVYTHIHTHIYTHIYTHIHTNKHIFSHIPQ